MSLSRPIIQDLSFEELQRHLLELGEPAYRAKQLWSALYKNFALDVDHITTFPQALRENISSQFQISALTPIKTLESRNRLTHKTLFSLVDGALVETVLMHYDERRTVCISSQSGCALGCTFCATGQIGFTRNLTVGEIVSQVIYYARKLIENNDRLTNVVLMGMGEPFLNYENVINAINRLTDAGGLAIGARRITISTIGIVPQIKQFADLQSQVNLAISLHTVDDELRSELMPINKKYPVTRLLDACRYYIKKTNRRITFEYALIDGVNDSPDQALALVRHIKNMLCHVNLIKLNQTPGFRKGGSADDQVTAFCQVLETHQISFSVRLSRGIDIAAGCGQLAAEH